MRADARIGAGSGLDTAGNVTLAERESDARVARIAHRIAIAGSSRCRNLSPAPGLVLQHLTQFRLADRPGVTLAHRLDRGPGVVAVVPGGPAARAGVVPGDVLLAIDGVPLPVEPFVDAAFHQSRARTRADMVLDLLLQDTPVELSLLRGGGTVRVALTPEPGCASRVHLARSDQRNAYADGRHVFLTTALVDEVDDAELAFMIAHEMSHNVLGHAAVMRGPAVRRGLGRTLGRSGEVVRAAERAADALGAELMLDAGYDPVAGARVLHRIDGDLRIGLFSAHDPTGDRIAAIRSIAVARARP